MDVLCPIWHAVMSIKLATRSPLEETFQAKSIFFDFSEHECYNSLSLLGGVSGLLWL
jgi:hypothetical protein